MPTGAIPLGLAHVERRSPRSDVKARIVDADDPRLPVGEIGEVVVLGDALMAGYWNKVDATAETMRGGWLHTGDWGSNGSPVVGSPLKSKGTHPLDEGAQVD